MKQNRPGQARNAHHYGLVTSMLILAAAVWSMVLFSPAQSPTGFVVLDEPAAAPAPVVEAARAAAETRQFVLIPNGLCKDTDRGKNYAVAGIVTAPDENNLIEQSPDACAVELAKGNFQSQGACAGELCVLLEQYCENDGIAQESYHCAAGCKDGRCVG